MSATLRRVKRWTILVHLYLGVALCALFAMWFATGVVLMYAGFPVLRDDVRVAGLPLVDCARCAVPPATAIAAMAATEPGTVVRVAMLLDRPVYRVTEATGRARALFADNGTLVDSIGVGVARAVASRFAGLSTSLVTETELLRDSDQWTVEGNLRSQLPLWRVDFGDRAGTVVYVASSTGEGLMRTTRHERMLAWVGAIPHWILACIAQI